MHHADPLQDIMLQHSYNSVWQNVIIHRMNSTIPTRGADHLRISFEVIRSDNLHWLHKTGVITGTIWIEATSLHYTRPTLERNLSNVEIFHEKLPTTDQVNKRMRKSLGKIYNIYCRSTTKETYVYIGDNKETKY